MTERTEEITVVIIQKEVVENNRIGEERMTDLGMIIQENKKEKIDHHRVETMETVLIHEVNHPPEETMTKNLVHQPEHKEGTVENF